MAHLVRLYTAYFLRQPDYAGLVYWLGQMFPSSGATGTSLAQVSGSFAQSAEFVNRYGSLSNDGFVNWFTKTYSVANQMQPEKPIG